MKKLLFVGASGMVAGRVLPRLCEEYEIVGISRKNKNLAQYCSTHLLGNLLTSHGELFAEAFSLHSYDVVVWNPVAFFPSRLIEARRETLHTEFDIAVALPLLCIQQYLAQAAPESKRFVGVSSQSAFGDRAPRASYSIVKRAQMDMLRTLSDECPEILFSILAPASVSNISDEALSGGFRDALSTEGSGAVIRINEDL